MKKDDGYAEDHVLGFDPVKSLTLGKCGCNFQKVTFKLISRMYILSIFCEIALRWNPQDLTDD